jgi:hypothetical protein
MTSAVFGPFQNPTLLRQEGNSLKVEDIAATGIDGQVALPSDVENIIGTLEGQTTSRSILWATSRTGALVLLSLQNWVISKLPDI